MARGRVSTRMEKNVTSNDITIVGAVDPHVSLPHLIQLEGGDEECQIKRIVLSGTLDDADDWAVLKLGLYQEAPSLSDLLSDSPVIYSVGLCNNNVSMINETTTVRVPRGWTLAVWIFDPNNVGVGSTVKAYFNLQLNYKVLS